MAWLSPRRSPTDCPSLPPGSAGYPRRSAGSSGCRPGRLVTGDDPVALGQVLRDWLNDAALRQQLRPAVRARRSSLPTWEQTVDELAAALTQFSATD
jgi:hypothetical protein